MRRSFDPSVLVGDSSGDRVLLGSPIDGVGETVLSRLGDLDLAGVAVLDLPLALLVSFDELVLLPLHQVGKSKKALSSIILKV